MRSLWLAYRRCRRSTRTEPIRGQTTTGEYRRDLHQLRPGRDAGEFWSGNLGWWRREGGFGPVTVNSSTSATAQIAVDPAGHAWAPNSGRPNGCRASVRYKWLQRAGPSAGPAPVVTIISPAEASPDVTAQTPVTGTVTSLEPGLPDAFLSGSNLVHVHAIRHWNDYQR